MAARRDEVRSGVRQPRGKQAGICGRDQCIRAAPDDQSLMLDTSEPRQAGPSRSGQDLMCVRPGIGKSCAMHAKLLPQQGVGRSWSPPVVHKVARIGPLGTAIRSVQEDRRPEERVTGHAAPSAGGRGQDQLANAARRIDGQLLGNHSAERQSEYVGSRNLQRIEKMADHPCVGVHRQGWPGGGGPSRSGYVYLDQPRVGEMRLEVRPHLQRQPQSVHQQQGKAVTDLAHIQITTAHVDGAHRSRRLIDGPGAHAVGSCLVNGLRPVPARTVGRHEG